MHRDFRVLGTYQINPGPKTSRPRLNVLFWVALRHWQSQWIVTFGEELGSYQINTGSNADPD